MGRQLIDSRLRTGLEDHWPSLCTIRTVTYLPNAANQMIPAGPGDDVAGMVDLPCRMSPTVKSLVSYDEERTNKVTASYAQQQLLINAYLPTIQVRTYIAVVDGVTYQIRGIDTDSQKFSTRLRLELVL